MTQSEVLRSLPTFIRRRAPRASHTLLLSNKMLHELARVLRYSRLQTFYSLTEALVYEYVSFLRQCSDTVTLNPLVIAPIRDVNDLIVMQPRLSGKPTYYAAGTMISLGTPQVNT